MSKLFEGRYRKEIRKDRDLLHFDGKSLLFQEKNIPNPFVGHIGIYYWPPKLCHILLLADFGHQWCHLCLILGGYFCNYMSPLHSNIKSSKDMCDNYFRIVPVYFVLQIHRSNSMPN